MHTAMSRRQRMPKETKLRPSIPRPTPMPTRHWSQHPCRIQAERMVRMLHLHLPQSMTLQLVFRHLQPMQMGKHPNAIQRCPSAPDQVIPPAGGAITETQYGSGTSASTRWAKVRTQIDTSKWKTAYSYFDGLGVQNRQDRLIQMVMSM